MNEHRQHDRSLAEIVGEIKDELTEFVQTRVEMFKAELRETLQTVKLALPLGVAAAIFLLTAFLLLTLAAVALVAVAFWGSAYAWALSFLIVGVLWTIMGAMMAYFAWSRVRAKGMFPRKTIEVLKADKIWLQSEAKRA